MTLPRVLPTPTISEDDLKASVIDTFHIFKWRVAHFRPALTSKGWRTPVQADGKGWPDLFATRGPRAIVAELKSEKGRPTPEQEQWLADLASVPCIEVFVWRPSDWVSGEISRIISGVRR
jgi:hypothetical protein